MNWRNYIDSGDLELYVMGALDEHEAEKIRKAELEYPELAQEIDRIQSALIDSTKVSMNSERALKAALSEIDKGGIDSDKVILNNPKSTRKRANVLGGWAVAASLLFGISFVYNVYQASLIQDDSLRISKLIGKVERLNAQNAKMAAVVDSQFRATNELMAFMADGATKTVQLEGQSFAPKSEAMVYWNQQSAKVYVSTAGLPVINDNQSYQLWALVDGKPVDAGVFNSEKELQAGKKIFQADAFAVTIEPKGGSDQPTLSKLCVLGKLS